MSVTVANDSSHVMVAVVRIERNVVMISLEQQRLALDSIAVVAVLVTIYLGYLGVTKDYRDKDGQVTRWGRLAAGGIVVSGVLTILTTILQDRVSAAEKRVERAEQRRSYNRQLAEIRNVSNTTGDLVNQSEKLGKGAADLQNGMLSSIKIQRDLLGRSRRSISLARALEAQEQANSAAVLQRVWENSNQVRPGDIAVAASFDCVRKDGGSAPAMLLENARATLSVHVPGSVDTRQSISLRATRHEWVVAAERQVAGGTLRSQDSYFSPFIGDLGPLRNLSAWRGARLRLSLKGEQEHAIRLTGEEKRGWALVPCNVRMVVVVAGRSLVRTVGNLRQNILNEMAVMEITFPLSEVDADSLPRTGPATLHAIGVAR